LTRCHCPPPPLSQSQPPHPFPPSPPTRSYAAFNFDIVQPPSITAAAITFGVLGQILPSPSSPPYPITPSPLPDVLRGSMARHPLHPPPLPPLPSSPPSSPSQVEIIFDHTLLSSAALTLYSANILVDVITPQQFPKLNTSNFCFLSPLLCHMFPNDGIVLSIAAAAAPLISINTSGVSLSANTTLNFSAQSPSSPALTSFLNLSCSLGLAASLALGNNASGAVIVTAEFSLPLPVDIEVISSSIGPLDTQLLTQGINDLIKDIVLPWLNLKGQHEGFPVPVPPALQLSNTSLTAGDSYVAISSDLQLK
jgi:hypothetical protein